jgi:hypothetical protein
VVGEESVPNDFGLLFKTIVLEPSAGLESIAISAEWVAHQRKVEATAFLGLPHMCQLVHEKTLQVQRFLAEIRRPQVGMRVEMDVAHGGHGDAPRLERPPLAPDHSHAPVIDRIPKD